MILRISQFFIGLDIARNSAGSTDLLGRINLLRRLDLNLGNLYTTCMMTNLLIWFDLKLGLLYLTWIIAADFEKSNW